MSDEFDRQAVTDLCQTFTAGELHEAARALTGVEHLTTGRAAATVLVASGHGVAGVRRHLEADQ